MDDTNFESATSAELEQPAVESQETTAGEAPVEEASAAPAAPKSTRELLEEAFAKAEKQPTTDTAAPEQATTDAPKTVASKAPQSWTPATREKFASLPPDVQQEVMKRETEISRKLGETAQERKVAQEFMQVVSPYQEFFEKQGTNPMAATQELLQTAYHLRTGSPKQKAQIVAQLVKNFDIDFAEFDAALEATFDSKQASIPPELDQRLRQVETFAQQQQRQLAEQQQSQTQQLIEKFAKDPKNEFFADVQSDMVALIQAGKATDLQTAYDMAVWANPSTRKVLLQRQTDNKARLQAGGATLPNGGPRQTVETSKLKGKSTREILDQLVPKA